MLAAAVAQRPSTTQISSDWDHYRATVDMVMTLKNQWDYLLLANLEINPLRHLTPWWTRSSTRSATRDQHQQQLQSDIA